MRRLAGVPLAAVLVAGCAPIGGPALGQEQVIAATSEKMAQLRSARFDVTSCLLIQLPEVLLGDQPDAADLQDLNVEMRGSGSARFPDQSDLRLKLKRGGETLDAEIIQAGKTFYLKESQTGDWVVSSSGLMQLGELANPLSAAGYLKSARSIRDLGDTKLNGAEVYHYELVPERGRLMELLKSGEADPFVAGVLRQQLDRARFRVQVWIGKSDHLLHRVKSDLDASLDVSQGLSPLSSTGKPPQTLPSSANGFRLEAHAQLDYRDFNAPVTIAIPKVASSP